MILKIKDKKNLILDTYSKIKSGEFNLGYSLNKLNTPINENIFDKYLKSYLNKKEFEEIRDLLIKDDYLIVKENTQYSVYKTRNGDYPTYKSYNISIKGEKFIKSGGYCFKNYILASIKSLTLKDIIISIFSILIAVIIAIIVR